MIGLGSNRLSVCRRGGMSVTQAGKGGMEWLAGGRMPDWVSPYSAQATAALKAQFPTQWPTIRDYGFSHPALVPFINEDPMLVMSLIPELGYNRWLWTNGSATIDTLIVPTPQDIISCKWKSDANGGGYMTSTVGAWNTANPNNHWLFLKTNNTIEVWTFSEVQNMKNGVNTRTNLCSIVIDLANNRCSGSVGSSTFNNSINVYTADANQPSIKLGVQNSYNEWHEFRLSRNGVLLANLVPINYQGVVQMLNLATNTLCPKSGSGSFTISENPAS